MSRAGFLWVALVRASACAISDEKCDLGCSFVAANSASREAAYALAVSIAKRREGAYSFTRSATNMRREGLASSLDLDTRREPRCNHREVR